MPQEERELQFVVCIDNTDYPTALERRKIYQVLADHGAAQQHLLRVIDESGEDYLYPEQYFVALQVSPSLKAALLHAA